jgi:prevent-host-death family protein
MESYNVAKAKAHLSELIERAAAGEEIEISKRGEPMVRLVPAKNRKGKIDVAALRALTSTMKTYEDPEGLSFVERLRRDDLL